MMNMKKTNKSLFGIDSHYLSLNWRWFILDVEIGSSIGFQE